jgi:hypothetical protein
VGTSGTYERAFKFSSGGISLTPNRSVLLSLAGIDDPGGVVDEPLAVIATAGAAGVFVSVNGSDVTDDGVDGIVVNDGKGAAIVGGAPGDGNVEFAVTLATVAGLGGLVGNNGGGMAGDGGTLGIVTGGDDNDAIVVGCDDVDDEAARAAKEFVDGTVVSLGNNNVVNGTGAFTGNDGG